MLVFGVVFISRPCLFLDLYKVFWTCPSFILPLNCHWKSPIKKRSGEFLKLKKQKNKRWQVTAKATVLFATTASFGMLVMSMQNLGLIGMMTVEWPVGLDGIFSICKFLLLDIDSYGFSCVAGRSEVSRKKTRLGNWINRSRLESPGRCILPSKYPTSQISVVWRILVLS